MMELLSSLSPVLGTGEPEGSEVGIAEVLVLVTSDGRRLGVNGRGRVLRLQYPPRELAHRPFLQLKSRFWLGQILIP